MPAQHAWSNNIKVLQKLSEISREELYHKILIFGGNFNLGLIMSFLLWDLYLYQVW